MFTFIRAKLRDLKNGVKRSPLWPKTRDAHLKLFPTCAACGRKTHLNVHHKKPFHLFPLLELVESNLITLCEFPSENCHLRLGHLLLWASYNKHVEDDASLSLQRITNRP